MRRNKGLTRVGTLQDATMHGKRLLEPISDPRRATPGLGGVVLSVGRLLEVNRPSPVVSTSPRRR
jgi:hypothetical protein